MTRISLLPPELKKQQRFSDAKGVYLKIAAGTVAVFLLMFLLLAFLTMGANRELNTLRSQRETIDQQISQLREYEMMAATITEIDNIGKAAIGLVPNWRAVLHDVGNGVPADLWLTDFVGAQSGEIREVTIRGSAASHRTVADWLNELYSVENLKDVSCQISTEVMVDNQPRVTFEIRAIVLPEEAESPLDRGGF